MRKRRSKGDSKAFGLRILKVGVALYREGDMGEEQAWEEIKSSVLDI